MKSIKISPESPVKSDSATPTVSCDGQVNMGIQAGDTIYIRKKPHKLTLIHPEGHEFYQTCRDKLGWGTQLLED